MRNRARLALIGLLALPPAGGAQPVPPPPAAEGEATPPEAQIRPYATTIRPTGDSGLDAALAAASRLVTLQDRAPVDLPGLLARARGDAERLRAALDSEGYFAGAARVEVAGQDPASPGFRPPPPNGPVPVTIIAEPGPRYRIARLDTQAAQEADAAARAAAPLQDLVGEPARGAAVVEAQEALLERLLAAGHPFARVAERDVVVDHDRREMRLAFTLDPGPFARFAAAEVSGTERVNPRFLARYVDARLAGRPYDPARLSRAQADVTALGVFDSVRLSTGERLDAAGDLPVALVVNERARRAIGLNAAYETRLGATLGAFFEHRNVGGNAERLRLEAAATRLGASDATRTGGRVAATWRDPFFLNRDLALVATIALLRERLESFDRDALVGSVLVERRLSDRLVFSTGPVFEVGRSGPTRGRLEPTEVLGWQFGLRWDSTDSLLDPRRGFRATATLTPSYTLEEGTAYVFARAGASTYWDVNGTGRSILAGRVAYGTLLGVKAGDVPFSQRFFAGGGGSVRGYDFQSISPRDAAGQKVGGASLAEASVEWRQRLGGNWGAVGFVDAGYVGGGGEESAWRVGVGAGVRYFTAIGPVRADFALPLVRQRGSQGYGIYIGIGQAF